MVMHYVTEFLEDYWAGFALIGILFIPTGLYYYMINQGYTVPFFISTLAFNTIQKLIGGLGIGIFLGFVITKKFGD